MVGQNWFHRFMERNKELTVRKPERLSRARIGGMKSSRVLQDFGNLSRQDQFKSET